MPNISIALPGQPDFITPPGDETVGGAPSAPIDPFAGSRVLKANPYAGSSVVTKSKVSPERALGEGFLSGLTADNSDELTGLSAASGAPGFKWLSAPVGAAKLMAEDTHVIKGDNPGEKPVYEPGPVHTQYQAARDEVRKTQQDAQEEHPYLYGGGALAGAVVPMIASRGAVGETIPARMMSGVKTGIPYGALSGFGGGEGADSSITGAGIGAGTGGFLGAAAPVAGNILAAPFSKAISAYKSASDPTGTALRALVNVARKDNPGMTDAEIVKNVRANILGANHQGQNLSLGEALGENTRGLARSAFNLSDEAKGLLESYTRGEFHGQSTRAQNFFSGLVPGGKSPVQLQQAADDAQRAANAPAYKKAFSQGDRPLWGPEFEALAQDPVMQSAIRRAAVKARTENTLQGYAPMNVPFDFSASTGTLRLKTDPNGNKIFPNLQFWDLVKRELDTGDRNSQSFAKALRQQLDHEVPSYKNAREGAMSFFQAENAYDAGKKFVLSKSTPEFDIEAARQLRKMTPQQRELFANGFAGEMQRVMGQIGDSQDVLRSTFLTNPNARKRIEIALGPQRTDELEAFLHVERMKKAMHGALGNSTTARQQYHMGAAGAVGLGSAEAFREQITDNGLDPVKIFSAALFGGAAGYASSRIRGINDKIAGQITQMLLSSDPAVLEKGLKLVASRPALMSRLRSATWDTAPQGINPIIGGARNRMIGGSVPAVADENQGSNN